MAEASAVRHVHTVGDSHSRFGWQSMRVPGVQIHVHHIGPKLMHSFGRDGPPMLGGALRDVAAGSVVCFCFGEIDCRCHVHKQVEGQGRALDDVTSALVDAYMRAIAQTVDGQAWAVWVYNVVPASRRDSTPNNAEYPFLGTDAQRVAYTRAVNAHLRSACAERGHTFVDVHDAYADADGLLVKGLSDGCVHIADVRYLVPFVRRALALDAPGEGDE